MDDKITNIIELANSEMNAKRYNEAINFYDKVLEINTNLENVWYLKALAVFKSSTLGNCRFIESKSFFEKAIDVSLDKTNTKNLISENIVTLSLTYFPSYEEFFKDHFMAPSSVDSLLNAYIEFDTMLFWATELDPENKLAFQTGYNLCRQIIEMPKKYVNEKAWGALGKELAGKITKNYSTELDGKINKQLAQETKRKLENFESLLIPRGKKYETGIDGIPELKLLLSHNSILIEKPKLSSEGKTFEVWKTKQRNNNKISFIIGIAVFGLAFYNFKNNYFEFTFWTYIWILGGIILVLAPIYNKPTLVKYNKQQNDLGDWINKAHAYIIDNSISPNLLKMLVSKSENIFNSYLFFNKQQSNQTPKSILEEFNKQFFLSDSPYKLSNTKEDSLWYYSINQKEYGPYSTEELILLIDIDTLVWRLGIDWTNANEILELRILFAKK